MLTTFLARIAIKIQELGIPEAETERLSNLHNFHYQVHRAAS